MKRFLLVSSLLIVFAISISACGSSELDSEPQVQVEQPPEAGIDSVEEEIAAADVQPEEQPSEPAASYPNWYSTSLTDVNTGSVFTINDNLGKVILVETMATWCSKCLQQQSEVARFHQLLGERDDFLSLGVNIDTNEDIVLLTGYVRKNGFDWVYVVADGEMINEISSLYGPQFLNPPSTPMLIIDRKGNAHTLDFGIKSAEELLNSVQPYLDEAA